MFEQKHIDATDKPGFYRELAGQARGLLHGERNLIANAANFSSLLYHAMPEVNWVGFYFMEDGELVVGPFQGKPACVRIAVGKGVCGTAVAKRETQLVPDVDAFPGHIPCDSASRSEIVVPLEVNGEIIGVLDIDSPVKGRFDEEDRRGVEALAGVFVESVGQK
ncbi:MAG TPA: GAF domain-containing protein [Gammaproteobacteria bacterium]|nr:GAF domain-containing protein [Gammaproteobacteria bacterium]